ncbi:GNAT family N-acetyltransferase [Floricoccus penangensis]|uniref:GNAT family N-acetyltransferase n=1 Tax=Floricoccus penangensis TaxID=1859475 RepID=UPI00203BB67E|nr:GNAT family N-acetyltransferase [Floricoccus penangensis]URZ86630.1 GNAT family N-acetyltransferase [Floricoccus penangensis]
MKLKNVKINQLSQKNAEVIADTWKYEEPFSFYNMTEDPEDYKELISAQGRGKNYYQVLLDNELIGYFCLFKSGDGLEIGLGLKPNLTGKGIGDQFFQIILDYINQNFKVKQINLAVAEFNKRAHKLYLNHGFKDIELYDQATNGDVYPFIKMSKTLN